MLKAPKIRVKDTPSRVKLTVLAKVKQRRQSSPAAAAGGAHRPSASIRLSRAI